MSGGKDSPSQIPQMETISSQDMVIESKKILETVTDVKLKQKFQQDYDTYAKLLTERKTDVSESMKKQIEEMYEDLQMLQYIEQTFKGLNEGYETSIQYLFSNEISHEQRKSLLNIMKEKTDDIREFFEDFGYLNQQNIAQFQEKFKISKVQEKEELDKGNKKYYTQWLDIKNKIEGLEGSKGLRDLQIILSKFSKDEHDIDSMARYVGEVKAYLTNLSKENPQEFAKLLKTIKDADEKAGRKSQDSAFESIKTFAQQSSPELYLQITRFETTYKYTPAPSLNPSPLRADVEVGLDYKPVGNKLEAQRQVGDSKEIITYDPKTGQRDLKLEGSEYALATQIPNREIQPQIMEYEKVRMQEQPKIEKFTNLLNFLDQPNILSQLSELVKSGKSLVSALSEAAGGYSAFVKLQESLKSEGIDINSLKTVDDFRNLTQMVREKRDEAQKKLDEAKKVYEDVLEQYQITFKLKLQEKDKLVREILVFFRSIGFDIIPKSQTDSIIAEVQSGGSLTKLGFTSKIDLKKGILGIDNGKTGLQESEKQGFLKFYNKMISGDTTQPLSYEGGKIYFIGNDGIKKPLNDLGAFKNYLYYNSSIFKSGIFQRNIARDNILK